MRDFQHLFYLFGVALVALVPLPAAMSYAGWPMSYAYLAAGLFSASVTLPYVALLHAKREAQAALKERTGTAG